MNTYIRVRHFDAAHLAIPELRKAINADFDAIGFRDNHGHALRVSKNSKYLTVAYAMDRDTNKLIDMGYSICHSNDIPNRKRGYQIAIGRLNKHFKE